MMDVRLLNQFEDGHKKDQVKSNRNKWIYMKRLLLVEQLKEVCLVPSRWMYLETGAIDHVTFLSKIKFKMLYN